MSCCASAALWLLWVAMVIAEEPAGDGNPEPGGRHYVAESRERSGGLQGAGDGNPKLLPTAAEIQSQAQQAAAADLDDAAKAKIAKLYQQALAELTAAEKSAAAADAWRQRMSEAPARLAKLKREIATGPAPAANVPPEADAGELSQLIADAKAAFKDAQQRCDAAEAEPARRTARQAELTALIAAAAARLAAMEKERSELDERNASSPVAIAEQTHRRLRVMALSAQGDALRAEAEALEATAGQSRWERDAAAAQLAPLKKHVESLTKRVAERRRMEAAKELQLAQRETALAHPAVKAVLAENARLIEERQRLAQDRSRIDQQLAQMTELYDAWRKTIERTKAKVRAAGLSETIGLMLRKQRRELPDPSFHRSQPQARQPLVRQVQYRRLELHDARGDLADVADEVQATLGGLDWPVGDDEHQEIEFAAHEAYEQRRKQIDTLAAEYDAYFESLAELDAIQRQIAEQSHDYAGFIGERILWIRSTAPLTERPLAGLSESLARLTSPDAWLGVGKALWLDVLRHPLAYALALVAGLFLLRHHLAMRQRISEIGRQVRNNPAVPVRRSFEAFLLTLELAMFWPGLMLLASWRLGSAEAATELSRALAMGVSLAACTCLFFEVPRRVLRERGLAEAHFQWPAQAVAHLRDVLRVLLLVQVPAALVIGTTEALAGRTRDDALGRAVFVATMLIVAGVAWRLLRHRGRLMRALLAQWPNGWFYRLRKHWLWPGIAGPLALAVLAGAGYYYSALELTWRAQISMALLFALVSMQGLGVRWLVAARVQLARLRMQFDPGTEIVPASPLARVAGDSVRPGDFAHAMLAEHDGPARLDDTDARIALAVQRQRRGIDPATIKAQTRRVLITLLCILGAVGLWLIWIDVFPALNVLRRVPLGGTTLAHVVVAATIGLVAIVALRNLPGLLEVLGLSRLPLDNGARYAVATICRYTISVMAVILIAWLIGFDWSKIQWLVAAMLVGLGFGLQEIFANFVSGLIILLERPVRPGDTITIGETSGEVLRIQMRATTIRDGDCKELIVPNKEIVTGRVVNWSLSDTTLRIVIPVGIAYGSDTELATQILSRIASEHPKVLQTPKSQVVFSQFGESALVFQLRVFVPHAEHSNRVTHELHTAIDREFRQAGIAIASPQLDLRIRAIDPSVLSAARRDRAA
jgi:potassium efflux system protein